MATFRKILFWLHLSAGVAAGVVILIMSATGVALTYERQMGEWANRHLRSAVPASEARRLSVEAVLRIVQRDHRDAAVSAITMGSAADAPVTVAARPENLYLDAYTGRQLGERHEGGLRAFLSSMRSWHRWLAVTGDGRTAARAITGWSNLLFLFIVASGMYLWLPRVLNWKQIKAVATFRRSYGTSKARDFNWHNVIGIWSAVPLFIVVLSAVPISFPWASDLVYRAVGEEPPPRRGRGEGPGGPAGRAGGERREGREGGRRPRAPISTDGFDTLFAQAAADQPGWRTISLRVPQDAADPLVFNIDRGDGGQPHLRSTLTLDRDANVVERETFADLTLGRQIRNVMRFAHTGEVLGLPGQTIAGLVSAGGVVLVWTGLALSWRRFRAWRTRRTPSAEPSGHGSVRLDPDARPARYALRARQAAPITGEVVK
jgi:uncharacterized iron-regulated membrane protein